MIRTSLGEERLLYDIGILTVRGVGLVVDQARPYSTRLPPEVGFAIQADWFPRFGPIVKADELLCSSARGGLYRV